MVGTDADLLLRLEKPGGVVDGVLRGESERRVSSASAPTG
jgi:hypothetical protein